MTSYTKEGLLSYFQQFLNGDRGEASAEVLVDLALKVQSDTEYRMRVELALKPSSTVPATSGPVMTMRQWFADSEMRKLWAATWEHPVMKAGLQVIFQAGLPRPQTSLPQGIDLAQWMTLREGRYEGYFDALRMIEKLKLDPAPGGNSQPDEGWGGADLSNPPTNHTT